MIGHVVNIVQRLRKCQTTNLNGVGRTSQLREQLERWQIPKTTMFGCFQIPDSRVQHAIQVADALRYASLLYLHQVVPEIPSVQAEELARTVLVKLASVPPTSRTTNLQIFLLLIAGREVTIC